MEKAVLYRRKNHKVLLPGECSTWGIDNLARFLSADVKADVNSFREWFQEEGWNKRNFIFQNTNVDREGTILRLYFAYDDENDPNIPYFEISLSQLRYIFDKWEEGLNRQVDRIIITKNDSGNILVEFLEGIWTEYIVMVFYDLRDTYAPSEYSSDDVYNLGRFLFNDVGHNSETYKVKLNEANWDLINFEYTFLKNHGNQIAIYSRHTYNNDSDSLVFKLTLKQLLHVLDKWQEAIEKRVEKFIVEKHITSNDISVAHEDFDHMLPTGKRLL